MPRLFTGEDVFNKAIDRMISLYEDGHRIVVSMSGGKDSTCCLEVCLIAAKITGRLPVEVIMRDEEVMYPGTFEYVERVYNRPGIDMHWIVAGQPVTNVYNRASPYFWCFDDRLTPEEWMREPPSWSYRTEYIDIERMTYPERFPPDDGKDLFAIIGLRTSESRTRMMSVFSAKGHLTKPNRMGTRNCRPIYDWGDGDVWKAIHENGWDYNDAYDVFGRHGMPRNRMRIAPPTLTTAGVGQVQIAARAWPAWFDRFEQRCPGVRLAAKYGKQAVQPLRRYGETWKECFYRECINDAPEWIGQRATFYMEQKLSIHSAHSTTPFPEAKACPQCNAKIRSWRSLAMNLWDGDPFSLTGEGHPAVDPEFFREGAGVWMGSPSFT